VAAARCGREDDEAAVQRNGAELDAEAGALFVGEGGADFGPALTGLAVALVFLDGEDVEVGGGRSGQRLLHGGGSADGLVIATVHGVLSGMGSYRARGTVAYRRGVLTGYGISGGLMQICADGAQREKGGRSLECDLGGRAARGGDPPRVCASKRRLGAMW
jgi:hypothetical protein